MQYLLEQRASSAVLQSPAASASAVASDARDEGAAVESSGGPAAFVFPPLFDCPPFFPKKLLVRKVPWPEGASGAPLNATPEALRYMSHDPVPLVRMAYGFFYLPPAVAEALLHLALAAAVETLVVDFKCAERNLELPAAALVNFLPGLRSAHVAAFMKSGGLEGLVFRMGLEVLERRTLLGGAAVMLRLRANCLRTS